jgi:hypothetical protein
MCGISSKADQIYLVSSLRKKRDEDSILFYQSCFLFSDAGRVQVCPYPEAHAKGEARHAAALRAKAAQDADQVPRAPVEKVKHEDHVGNLLQSQAQAKRRLGIRKW